MFDQFGWGIESHRLVHQPTLIEAVEYHAYTFQTMPIMLKSYYNNKVIQLLFFCGLKINTVIYQWMVILLGTWLVTLIRRRSPSLATMRGPGNCPFTVTMLSVWHSLVTFWCLICVTTITQFVTHIDNITGTKNMSIINYGNNECCKEALQNGSVLCCQPEKPQTCKI